MYANAATAVFKSCRNTMPGFCSALDFALSADEVFELYNNAPCGYHSLDAKDMFLRVNNTELRWLGYTRDEMVGRMCFADVLTPESRDNYTHALSAFRQSGTLRETEFRLVRKDGSTIDVSLDCTAHYSDSGEFLSSRSRIVDITAQKRSEKGLQERERFIDRVLTATPDVVYVVDLKTQRNVFANREAAAQLGYTPEEIAAMNDSLFQRLIHPDDLPHVQAHVARLSEASDRDVYEIEYRMRRADGTFRLFTSRDTVFARDTKTGAVLQYLGVAQDVTEKRTAQQAIEEQNILLKEYARSVALQRDELHNANQSLQALASTDCLTGLFNHRVFQERLRTGFDQAREEDTVLSLLLLDIDYFKQYNDAFGHPAGDDVLCAVAGTLKTIARDTDTCARYGGEEFAVVLPQTDAPTAMQIAERIRHAIESIPDPNRAITSSIGVVSRRHDMTSPSVLISDADQAMYQAKRAGRNAVRHADKATPLPNETERNPDISSKKV